MRLLVLKGNQCLTLPKVFTSHTTKNPQSNINKKSSHKLIIMSVSLTESNNPGYGYQLSNSSSICEIEEEENSSELFEINHGVPVESVKEEFDGSLFSSDVHNSEDSVYVAVGKSESSMDALSWTLRHAVNPSTMIYLIHVFPETRHIPSPLGKLPKSQVSPDQVEIYMAQQRGKRRELLQKYLNMCSSSKIKVDTMLIESDEAAKAILNLIPILNIKKLVVGTTKSSIRKLKSRRGNGIADQILQNAPETCEIKIICEGKEVIDQMFESFSPRTNNDDTSKATQEENQRNDSFSCGMCFKPKFASE